MPVTRSVKSDGKRDSIVRAATLAMNAKGFARATMSEIAASLNLRDATLYYYFPNKRSLAEACHCRSLERFETVLAAAAEEPGTGAERLRNLIRLLIEDSFINGPQLYFGDYSYLDGPQRRMINQWGDKVKGMLEQFLKDGIDDGSLMPIDTEIAVQLFLGMFIWLTRWVTSEENLTADELYETIVRLALGGLEAQKA